MSADIRRGICCIRVCKAIAFVDLNRYILLLCAEIEECGCQIDLRNTERCNIEIVAGQLESTGGGVGKYKMISVS